MAGAADRRSGRSDLRVLHHFIDGVERTASEELLDGFRDRQGTVSITEELEHILRLRLKVKSDILRENPPDVWEEWPGKNLAPAVEAGVVTRITDLWTDNDWDDSFYDGVVTASRFDGDFYCVPFTLWRTNNLYYNRNLAAEAGIDVERLGSTREFVDALERADARLDETPCILPGKIPWGVSQLWETLLLSVGGASAHETIRNGNARSERRTIREALTALDAYFSHAPDDFRFLSSFAADDEYQTGNVLFDVNGNWSIGRFDEQENFEFGRDWDYVPFPGTDDCFLLSTDAFVPSSTADDDAAKAFLDYAGTREALRGFDVKIGSIPPRTDVSMDEFHPLTQRLSEDVDGSRHQVPSLTHGLAVDPDTVMKVKETLMDFIETRDVEASTSDLVSGLETE